MRKISRFALGLSLTVTCACLSAAQDSPSASIPKILQIQREYVKPGKAGLAHEKTESLFIAAMHHAKWPTHYLGMTSLSGKNRALFFTNYDSLEAMQKDGDAAGKNPTFTAEIDHATVVDGELLDETDSGVFRFHEEMSLRPRPDLSVARYMEILTFHVRVGKQKEWSELVNLAKDGYGKGVPEAHWGMFEQLFGGDGGTYILLIARKNLTEIDKGLGDDKLFAAAMGEDGMKKFNELYAATVESTQVQLFAFNANMSYVDDSWIKADPAFWTPKAPGASKAKPAAAEKAAKP
jgi:hypothetical protein